MAESGQTEFYEFSLEVLDPEVGEAELHRRLEEAVRAAVQEMEQEGAQVEAKAEIRGAFAGIGEVAVVLVVALLTGAATKIGEKAGEDFYTRYLAPRLKKMNLVPRSFRKRESKDDTTK